MFAPHKKNNRNDPAMKLKVSAICDSEAMVAALKAPDAAPAGVLVTAQLGSAQNVAGVLYRDQPDVLLLDFPAVNEMAMQQVESALLKAPRTHMVLVSPDRSVELLMRAMRAGVREVVPAPLSAATLQQIVERVQARQRASAAQQNPGAQVLAMLPAKGGAGATFLATNLAFALSRQGSRVALLDLNLYFGDAAIFLGDKPVVTSMMDLMRQVHRLDSALLNSSMIKVNENLHLLAASESVEDMGEASVAGVEKIIELARSQYDFVLLDLGSTIDQVALRALDLADTICLILQLNLPFVRAAKHMAAVFRQMGYSREKLCVVVNRNEDVGTINLASVEKTTQLKVGRTIPNSHSAVIASVNEGVPLLEMAPRDPVARALLAWAQELAPAMAQPRTRWWQRWMKSGA